jgi:hypothetical protein
VAVAVAMAGFGLGFGSFCWVIVVPKQGGAGMIGSFAIEGGSDLSRRPTV